MISPYKEYLAVAGTTRSQHGSFDKPEPQNS